MEDLYPTRGTEIRLLQRLDPVVSWPSRLPRDEQARFERFERDGYLFVPELFCRAETDALLAEANAMRCRAARERPREAFFEAGSDAVRSIFAVHQHSETFRAACEEPRLLELVESILGEEVYVHQSRLNYKPAFCGREFFWHSDFETWHAEDGMPRMRALSLSVSLTPSLTTNGPLMLIPGSHKVFVSCQGETPPEHYRKSLVRQEIGTPDPETVEDLAKRRGIKAPTGGPGSAALFDCNIMHGSNGNITPFPRINLFVVFNAVSNRLVAPFAAREPRPEFIGAREHASVLPRRQSQ